MTTVSVERSEDGQITFAVTGHAGHGPTRGRISCAPARPYWAMRCWRRWGRRIWRDGYGYCKRMTRQGISALRRHPDRAARSELKG